MSRSVSLAPKISLAPGVKTNNRVTLNVGGIRYQTNRSTLRAIPDTRLAWVTDTTASNPDYDSSTGEYFFDRHPGMFNMILNYYRTGKLHAPTDVCGPLYEEELAFWGIDEKQIEPCCWPTYRAHRDAQETLADFDNDNDDDDDDDGYDEDEIARRFGIVNEATKTEKSWFERWRPRVWTLLEEPYSSRAATVVTMCTSLFVILSIATYCAETHPLFRYTKNHTSLPSMPTVRETQRQTEPYLFMVVLEGCCMAFFTIDIIVRIIFSPNKKEHFLQAQTFFDVMSVLPFYIRSLVVAIDPDSATSDGLYFLNSLRLILIFRILKLTRHFSGFKILGHTLKASAKELLLMILVLSIGVLVFSCLVYYAEQLEEDSLNDFRNIPRGFWWAVVTMTTLGYGDMYPRTALGYIVGAVCALCGLLMLALPVPVIVSNFTLYYTHAQAKLKLPKKTRNTLVGAADALKVSMSDLESQRASTRDSLSSVTSYDSKPGAMSKTEQAQPIRIRQEELACALGKSLETNEEECSVDSGFKAWSPQEERSATGISVIFTDETRDSPDTPRISVSPRRGGNLRASAKRQRLSLCGPHRVSKITINRDRGSRKQQDIERAFSVDSKVHRARFHENGVDDGGGGEEKENHRILEVGAAEMRLENFTAGGGGGDKEEEGGGEGEGRREGEGGGGGRGKEEGGSGGGGKEEGGGGGRGGCGGGRGEEEEGGGGGGGTGGGAKWGEERGDDEERTECRHGILTNKTDCVRNAVEFSSSHEIIGETEVAGTTSPRAIGEALPVIDNCGTVDPQYHDHPHHQHNHHHHHRLHNMPLGEEPASSLHNGAKARMIRQSPNSSSASLVLDT